MRLRVARAFIAQIFICCLKLRRGSNQIPSHLTVFCAGRNISFVDRVIIADFALADFEKCSSSVLAKSN
jgi:hypothetical protein